MSKKPLNEVNISGFINRFLDDIQSGTQERFMKKAHKRMQDKEVHKKLRNIDKEIKDLEDYLKTL